MRLPPQPDEVEISLFGPGYGECVLLHPGDGKWFVIDSCIDPKSGHATALIYFDEIGVDPASAVQQVVATHWHDDHIRGLSEVFRVCRKADFVCSDAINNEEFSKIVVAYGHRMMTQFPSGVDEFRNIFEELKKRAIESGQKYIPPIFAGVNTCLWKSQIESSKIDFSIVALSPSNAARLASINSISELIPIYKCAKTCIPAYSTNHSAIALWISAGSLKALLGADLEESGDPLMGWSVIVNSPMRPQEKASVIKVPHHGSANAHCGKVWTDLIEDANPVAILSPFNLGAIVLPKDSDIARICSLTTAAYITAGAQKGKNIKRDKPVERMLREMGVAVNQITKSPGHVRLRARQGEPWKVDLFDGGKRLCEVAA